MIRNIIKAMDDIWKLVLASLGVIGFSQLSKGGTAVEDVANFSLLGKDHLPRGMRNNNPGNIEINPSNNWAGKIPPSQNTDGRFEQFEHYVDGVRAMIKLLRNYIVGYQRDTIPKIIKRYAPAADNNDVSAYISTVVNRSGISSDTTLNPNNRMQMYRLLEAMTYHENGREALSLPMFNLAWERAIA